MALKIAVTSTDGKVVNCHFGHAKRFLILDAYDNGAFRVTEERILGPVCMDCNHDPYRLAAVVHALADCDYLLTAAIGPRAEQELRRAGVSACVMPDTIRSAVGQLAIRRAAESRIADRRERGAENP